MKCLLQAFSVVTQIPFEVLDKMAGQKAETVLDNMAIGAARFRGLHIQELVDVALNFGWAVTEIEIAPTILRMTVNSERTGKPEVFPVYSENIQRFEMYIQHYAGIATCRIGQSTVDHAVAMIGSNIVDPTGLWTQGVPIHIDGFFILSRIHASSLRQDQQEELARLAADHREPDQSEPVQNESKSSLILP